MYTTPAMARASLAYCSGDLVKAEQIYEETIDALEQDPETNLHVIADCLVLLGAVYEDRNKLTEAEMVCQKVVLILAELYGPQHERVAIVLKNLARICTKLGKLQEAANMYQVADKILSRRLRELPR